MTYKLWVARKTHCASLRALHGLVLGWVPAPGLLALVRKHALLPVVEVLDGAQLDLLVRAVATQRLF
jgi:hypothetical protein